MGLVVELLILLLKAVFAPESLTTPSQPAAPNPNQLFPTSDLWRRAHLLREEAQALAERVGEGVDAPPEENVQRLRGPVVHELLAELDRYIQTMPRAAPRLQLHFAYKQLDYYQQLSDVLHLLVAQREDPRTLAIVGDADAFADACYSPVLEFARARELPLHSNVPVAVFGAFPMAIDLFFRRSEIAPLLLPRDYVREIVLWPAVAHEIAHDLYYSLPPLDAELTEKLGVPRMAPIPGAPEQVTAAYLDSLFGAWLSEVFADVLGTLILGPAYVVTMLEAFGEPEEPMRAGVAAGAGELIEAHPPAHVRVLLGFHVLHYLGRHQQADMLLDRWRERHGGLASIYLPLRDGRYLRIDEELIAPRVKRVVKILLDSRLDSFDRARLIEVPGLSYLHGEHAKVRELIPRLRRGRVVRGDPRLVVAAAVLAFDREPSAHGRILDAARRSIVGVGTGEPRPDPRPLTSEGGFGDRLRGSLRSPRALAEAMALGAAFARPTR